MKAETTQIFQDLVKLCQDDQAPMLTVLLNDHPGLVNLMDQNKRTLAHHAAMAGTWGCLLVLQQAGADMDAPDVSGETPLHRAISSRHLDASRSLLEMGANPNARNAYGGTPTLYAAELNPEALDMLIKNGGDTTVKDKQGLGLKEWETRGVFQQEQIKTALRAIGGANPDETRKPSTSKP